MSSGFLQNVTHLIRIHSLASPVSLQVHLNVLIVNLYCKYTLSYFECWHSDIKFILHTVHTVIKSKETLGTVKK